MNEKVRRSSRKDLDITSNYPMLRETKRKMNEDDPITHIRNATLVKLLKFNGITTLTEVQKRALAGGVLSYRNLFISAPSGSGKTIVAIMAMANTVINKLGKAVYLVPYKALAFEKEEELKRFFKPFNVVVKAITGDSNPGNDEWETASLIVTTYEKMDALIRRRNAILMEIKTLIIDEIHELANEHRGMKLELLIMNIFEVIGYIQIIALSATVSNPGEISAWLSFIAPEERPFTLIGVDERSVPLEYRIIISEDKIKTILEYISRCMDNRGQVLVFVTTRKECIRVSRLLARKTDKEDYAKYLTESMRKELNRIRTILKAKIGNGELSELLETGVCYHNASLDSQTRILIEDLYRKGIIKVLVSTTTLAAGVNTPARYVFVYSFARKRVHYKLDEFAGKLEGMRRSGILLPQFPHDNIVRDPEGIGLIIPYDRNMMFQMLGRAGRKGYEKKGYGIILVKNKIRAEFVRTYYFKKDLKNGNLVPKYNPVISRFIQPKFLREIILIRAVMKGTWSVKDFIYVIMRSFFFFQFENAPSEQKGGSVSSKKNIERAVQLFEDLMLVPPTFIYIIKNFGDPEYTHLFTDSKKRHNKKRAHYQDLGMDFDLKIVRVNDHFALIGVSEFNGNHTPNGMMSSQYYIEIDTEYGFRCSCLPVKAPSFKGIISKARSSNDLRKKIDNINPVKRAFNTWDLIEPEYFCRHVMYCLYYFWNHKNSSRTERAVFRIIETALKRIFDIKSLLPMLVHGGFLTIPDREGPYLEIEESRNIERPENEIPYRIIYERYKKLFEQNPYTHELLDNSYTAGYLGKIAVFSFIPPEYVEKIPKLIAHSGTITEDGLLSRILSLFYGFKRPAVDYITLAGFIRGWISEEPSEQLYNKFPKISPGDFLSFKDDLVRLCKVFANIAAINSDRTVSEMAMTLSKRILYGVKKDLIAFIEQNPKLTRIRARQLYRRSKVVEKKLSSNLI